ncbi:MAG TPA: hypothetical protein DCS07_14510 [Bdellovibrionales bacterium]|nr:MAG: hypothetical protein A2Z97_04805 [Bdellovibrionales bacterium GWB1_52_6]OFZ05572.1 MAG: hypothetical protein A2X97_11940 [Bdellovibrionales bacterium GWA1_52_35]OFZ41462.1 MAG: hypothetical protein A2070_06495 [Bdellovibrionales bacterium GWC1_52_8]HAR43823.1 hypothetical protein [Bdellovibrionales bacterium]HCM39056.1 hypothetical protein [Bdellovibrionales bacterium]
MKDLGFTNFSGVALSLALVLLTSCQSDFVAPKPLTFTETPKTRDTLPTDIAANTNEVLAGKEYIDLNGERKKGTLTVHSAISPDPGAPWIKPSSGYYDGSISVTFDDPNLIPANIKAGVSIFGVTGASFVISTRITSDAATTSDILVGKTGWVNGAQITGSAASANPLIASWNYDAVNQWIEADIPNGRYPAQSACQFTDVDLIPANICAGRTIFTVTGATVCNGAAGAGMVAPGNQICTGYYGYDNTGTLSPGSANCSGKNYTFKDYVSSNEHRDKATAPITLDTEATTNAGQNYTNTDPGYRAVPKISKDDDSGTPIDRSKWNHCKADRTTYNANATYPCKCGTTTGNTIAQRISDCAANGGIGSEATWDGTNRGNSGQGTWRLVTRISYASGVPNPSQTNPNDLNEYGKEVWQDQRTGLLWSSGQGLTNWCKASGNNNITDNPTAEADPAGICDNSTYQATSNPAYSMCFEDATHATDRNVGYYYLGGNYNYGKGGLTDTSSPKVSWRLPSAHDYMIAEINGLRFVLPDTRFNMLNPTEVEWTASVVSSSPDSAWVFNSQTGELTQQLRSGAAIVRCVGAVYP